MIHLSIFHFFFSFLFYFVLCYLLLLFYFFSFLSRLFFISRFRFNFQFSFHFFPLVFSFLFHCLSLSLPPFPKNKYTLRLSGNLRILKKKKNPCPSKFMSRKKWITSLLSLPANRLRVGCCTC